MHMEIKRNRVAISLNVWHQLISIKYNHEIENERKTIQYHLHNNYIIYQINWI